MLSVSGMVPRNYSTMYSWTALPPPVKPWQLLRWCNVLGHLDRALVMLFLGSEGWSCPGGRHVVCVRKVVIVKYLQLGCAFLSELCWSNLGHWNKRVSSSWLLCSHSPPCWRLLKHTVLCIGLGACVDVSHPTNVKTEFFFLCSSLFQKDPENKNDTPACCQCFSQLSYFKTVFFLSNVWRMMGNLDTFFHVYFPRKMYKINLPVRATNQRSRAHCQC